MAQKWAEHIARSGKFEHSRNKGYGENIAMRWSSKKDGNLGKLVKQAVNDWYNEVSQYNYKNPNPSGGTGHFTQVVWKSSKSLGLGLAFKGNSVYIVGNYKPPGNYVGRYTQNVRPPV